jgi:predicted dehydrogenase
MNPLRTRREFIRDTALLAGGAAAAGHWSAQAAKRKLSSNDKLNLGIIGAGGRGWDNLMGVQSENIVALCDVDEVRAGEAFKKFPEAKRYRDFRQMLDRESTLDAVVVSTPDHTHAVAAIAAMKRGLHVYCEKPLAHSIYEARQMAKVAKEMGVVTQMGQQGHAMEGSRRAVEVVRSGAIGEVTELHVWTDRPAGWWPQGEDRPKDTPAVPPTLDWDLWLGPAPWRPYHSVYVPFKWHRADRGYGRA